MGQVGGMVETKEKQPVLFLVYVNQKEKKKLNKKEHIYVLILFLHRPGDREQRE